jgi:ABC-type amino acid transport/signal transduction systems, periplasmic component/domain
VKSKLIPILLSFCAAPCLAKTFQVAVNQNSPPYAYVADGHVYGLNVEIIKSIMQQLGHSIQLEALTDKGLIVEAEYGKRIDIVVGGLPYSEKIGYLSDPLYSSEVVAISKKKDKIKVKNLEDLKALKLAAGPWLWEKLGPEFMRIYEPKKRPTTYHEFITREEQHKSFWSGRTQVIICDRAIFDYYQEFLAGIVDTTDTIQVHKISLKSPPPRVFFRNRELRDQFNLALDKFRMSVAYERLIQMHLRTQKSGAELIADHR